MVLASALLPVAESAQTPQLDVIDLTAARRFDLGSGFGMDAVVGVIGHVVDSELLREHIEPLARIWSVGFNWRQLGLRWAGNTYGTAQRHLSLTYRVAGGSGASGNAW